MLNLPPIMVFWAARALFELVLTISNVFGTDSSPAAFTGDVALTLFATTCVVARKYGAKLPDFVITFMIFNWDTDFIEIFTKKIQFFVNYFEDVPVTFRLMSEWKKSRLTDIKLATNRKCHRQCVSCCHSCNYVVDCWCRTRCWPFKQRKNDEFYNVFLKLFSNHENEMKKN